MINSIRCYILPFLIAVVCFSYPLFAIAYEANVGDRAANLKGFDIVSHQPIELDEYLGKWVIIEFWATWCGPCLDELLYMFEIADPLVEAGNLHVITISADTSETLTILSRAIREHRITYPVIYDGGVYDMEGGGLPIPAIEWGVECFPSSFLINPQGVIVANNLRGESLAEILDFCINNERPLVGLRGSQIQNDDGSISVIAEVMNCGREDVAVSLYAYQIRYFWGDDNIVYDEEIIYADQLYDSAVVRFDEFSDSTHEFNLPADVNLYILDCFLYATVPGSEYIGGGDRSGIEFMYNCESMLLFHTDYVDGKYIIQP